MVVRAQMTTTNIDAQPNYRDEMHRPFWLYLYSVLLCTEPFGIILLLVPTPIKCYCCFFSFCTSRMYIIQIKQTLPYLTYLTVYIYANCTPRPCPYTVRRNIIIIITNAYPIKINRYSAERMCGIRRSDREDYICGSKS